MKPSEWGPVDTLEGAYDVCFEQDALPRSRD